jgi:predicted porin
MKKTLIALAAVAATGAVFAQSTATISGSINVGVMDTGAAGAKAAVSSLGGGANALNILTSEDLGGGLKAGLTSQIRFNAATGDTNSSGVTDGQQLFHAANVFVSGGFGTVRIGKIAETGNCGFDPWACTGGAALQGGVGLSALVASGTQASSMSYMTPNFSGFTAGYQTSISARSNERSVLNVGYAQGPVAVNFVRAENTANVRAPGGAAPTDAKATQQSIAGSYDLGAAKLSLVNTVAKNAAKVKTANVVSLGVSVPMGAVTLLAGYNKDREAASNADTKIAFGANYALSKRTTVGADLFKAEAPGAGTGYVARIRHTF